MGHFHLAFHMIITVTLGYYGNSSMRSGFLVSFLLPLPELQNDCNLRFCCVYARVLCHMLRLPLLWRGGGENEPVMCACVRVCVCACVCVLCLLSLQWGCWPCQFQLLHPRATGSTVISVMLLSQKDAPSCWQLWQACSLSLCPHLKMCPALSLLNFSKVENIRNVIYSSMRLWVPASAGCSKGTDSIWTCRPVHINDCWNIQSVSLTMKLLLAKIAGNIWNTSITVKDPPLLISAGCSAWFYIAPQSALTAWSRLGLVCSLNPTASQAACSSCPCSVRPSLPFYLSLASSVFFSSVFYISFCLIAAGRLRWPEHGGDWFCNVPPCSVGLLWLISCECIPGQTNCQWIIQAPVAWQRSIPAATVLSHL